MKLYEKAIESKEIYKGKILCLKLDTVKLPDGNTSTREIVNHPGAVCVAAITDKKELVFVKQYRHACLKTLLELPAGKLEKEENVLEAASRELREETGIVGTEFKYLDYIYMTPGYSNEIIHLYVCKVKREEELNLDEDEFVEPVKIDINKAYQMVINGEIHDSKTQILIFKVYNLVRSEKLDFVY